VSYRPIADLWILARPKVKYYGAYPAGFLQRARDLLGVTWDDPILHVCAGKIREYPYKGVGKNDRTLDVRSDLKPDILGDVTKTPIERLSTIGQPGWFAAMLADPPYTDEDAARYGAASRPLPGPLAAQMIDALEVGCRAGLLHYEWPSLPSNAREVAVVGVTTGRRQRMRQYTVLERIR
jgi:hypothetical protein